MLKYPQKLKAIAHLRRNCDRSHPRRGSSTQNRLGGDRIMTLLEFLTKWELSQNYEIFNLLAAFFERDIRTIQRWQQKTPRYARWIFSEVNTKWEESGKTYRIFFDF
ncbi:hypothetical protein LC605_15015 [Nostoc sp. CHAB 5836]|uniref:hypothetical protein n=1 Tax=Nostoc sp. CHAB 5836 TaxID=2780404 RepID=UPI001E484107|nr:hypothetical protein [Nostoc sp. CHAB 5836]MCC5616356.1 hypothetical protein [Nostoc sp. CHAB 5836]